MAGQKSSGRKKTNWKIILIVLGIIVIAAGFLIITMKLMTSRPSNKYEEVLASYYKCKAEGSTNSLLLLITKNFEDDLSFIDFKSSTYSIYAYNFVEEEKTNDIIQAKKITYSITFTENNSPVSYLCEAYFVKEDETIKLIYIKKLYKGKNITRMTRKNLIKV